MGSTNSGGWKNYCMAGKHIHITNLFLNDFTKMVHFLNIWQLEDNSRCLDTG
jgi:hypothetical protein